MKLKYDISNGDIDSNKTIFNRYIIPQELKNQELYIP